MEACKCGSTDLVGPYEMDGYDKGGKYQAKGLFWTTCRGCGRNRLERDIWRDPSAAIERLRASA